MAAAPVVETYTGRWSIETTLQGMRAYLGLETTRGWKEATVLRLASCLFGLFSVAAINKREKRPCRQQGGVDDAFPGGPFLREDQREVFGGKNLAQTEIEIGLLSLVQAKDLVPQPGRGRA